MRSLLLYRSCVLNPIILDGIVSHLQYQEAQELRRVRRAWKAQTDVTLRRLYDEIELVLSTHESVRRRSPRVQCTTPANEWRIRVSLNKITSGDISWHHYVPCIEQTVLPDVPIRYMKLVKRKAEVLAQARFSSSRLWERKVGEIARVRFFTVSGGWHLRDVTISPNGLIQFPMYLKALNAISPREASCYSYDQLVDPLPRFF